MANERTLMLACIRIGGVPLVHPPGHPQAGDMVEFPVRVPGAYEMTIRIPNVPSCWERFHVDIDEDGRARVRLVEESVQDGFGLTSLERELLDGLARIIARDILRRQEVA